MDESPGLANDAALIEQSLAALAEAGVEIRYALFERFFAAYPERRASFLNLEVSSIRMTDETLQMMHGLAAGENWVGPLVNELSFTHRNYGVLPDAEYDAFIDMTVEAVLAVAGNVSALAWRRQAERLKLMVATARREWTRVMPGAVSA